MSISAFACAVCTQCAHSAREPKCAQCKSKGSTRHVPNLEDAQRDAVLQKWTSLSSTSAICDLCIRTALPVSSSYPCRLPHVVQSLRHDSPLLIQVFFLLGPGVQASIRDFWFPHGERRFINRLGRVVYLLQACLDEEGIVVRLIVGARTVGRIGPYTSPRNSG